MLSESFFYVACMLHAVKMSHFQPDFDFTPERRKLLWRRILDDASVSPQVTKDAHSNQTSPVHHHEYDTWKQTRQQQS